MDPIPIKKAIKVMMNMKKIICENRFGKTLCFKRTSVIMEKTNNKCSSALKEQHINHFGLKLLFTAYEVVHDYDKWVARDGFMFQFDIYVRKIT